MDVDRRTVLTLPLMAAFGGLALSACAPTPQANGGLATVRWGVTALNGNWDPIVTGATGATITMTPIYESFLLRGADGSLSPALAEGYAYEPAGDAVTFTLKRGLTFHDGSAVDAAAAVAFIQRAQQQEGSALAGSYRNIVGVEALDEQRFRLALGQPDHQIPYLLSNRAGLLTKPVAAGDEAAQLNATLPVGAGPFRVVELVPEDRIVLERFDGYWNAAEIHVDRIEISGGNEDAMLVSGLRTSVFDFASISNLRIDEAEQAGLDVIEDLATNWVTSFVSLNLNQAPFDDPAVVEAVRYAIDRDAFVQNLTAGHGVAVHQPFPPGHVTFVDELEQEFTYDADRARDILADAGYVEGDLSITIHPFTGGEVAAEILQAQLGEIGIAATIQVDANWGAGYFGKTYGIATYGYVGRDSHVQALTEHFDTGGVLNLSSPYTSQPFQDALAVVRATPLDDPAYGERLRTAAAAGYRHGSTIALYSSPNTWAKQPTISDSTETIEGRLGWTGVEVTEEG